MTKVNLEKIKDDLSSKFRGLAFDEESHTYTLNGKQLTSATTYLKRFTDTFNAFHASEAKGKKILSENADDKRTGQYYRKRWNYIKDEATIMGSRIHLYAECYPYFDDPIDWREQAVLDFYKWLPDNYVQLFAEFRVYDEDTLHAGTIDGILYNKKTGNLVIIDWKTNSRHINEVYKNKNLKGSFSKLKDTSLNKYSIQLSDYANIIQKNTDYKVEERWVVWIRQGDVSVKDADRSDDYSIINIKCDLDKTNFKLYKVKDYTKDIAGCFNEDKEELLKAATPAKVTKGLFSKKTSQPVKTTKKKGLFAKK